ncbi:MAG: restriction endonuclease [Methanotrichaceae archaeon]|nr:restriction endonuclease [Methanotrichaceae archaeon]
MSVPDFQSLFLPLLKFAGDGEEHQLNDAIQTISAQLNLTEDDKKELLPSGRQTKFDNRVSWARTYLTKAGLMERTGRGRFRITSRGIDVLKTNPTTLNVRFLEQYPEFLKFHEVAHDKGQKTPELAEEANRTPEEQLETSYLELKQDLAQELLNRVKECSSTFFERLVVDLLVAMDYGGTVKDAGQAVGQSGDGGIDGIIKEDKLGLDIVYIQAKRWEGAVGGSVVRNFAGSLDGVRAKKGVLITTSQFTQDAKDYANKIEKKIVLVDGDQLAQLMIDHNVGVAEKATYTIKRIDLDYFGEE